MEKLPINYKYYIYFFEKNIKDISKTKVLDFGCGDGTIVKAARDLGYDFRGCENYYNDQKYKIKLEMSNKPYIDLYDGYKLPYSDEYFDLIFSNQVFEHVENIEIVLKEMFRVLKKNGIMLHNFPVKEYIIEGHYGIPFQHKFSPKYNYMRVLLTRFFYFIGFGHKHYRNLGSDEFTTASINFIDKKCYYRSEKTIKTHFYKYFKIKFIEKNKIIFHLENRKTYSAYVLLKIIKKIPNYLLHKIEKRRESILIHAKKEIH